MKNPIFLSLALLITVVVWMLSGVLAKAPQTAQAQQENPQSEPMIMKVRVRSMLAKSIERKIIIQGELESQRQVTVKAEIGSRVTKILVRKGEQVQAGTKLVVLAEEDRLELVKQARAEVESQQHEVSAIRKLKKQGLQAETRLKAAEAALASARAQLKRAQLDFDYLQVKAPFDGIVEQRYVEIGSHVERGDPVVLMVDKSSLKAVGRVSQQSADQLELGQRIQVRLLNNREASAYITFISRLGDSETHSFRVEAEVPNPDARLNAGVSAELSITVGEEMAHFLSPSILSLDDQGAVGVKSVDESNRVRFHPVELVRSEVDGIWLSGLPEQVRVITQGQGFVNAGDAVVPVEEQGG